MRGYSYNVEELAAAISNIIEMRKMMKEPLDVRGGNPTNNVIVTKPKDKYPADLM